MKQKIFSLLVLMITTVCGAWAQDEDPTFKVKLTVNCSGLGVENVLFYSTEFFENKLLGGILISEFDLEENYFHVEKGLVVEISQIESPSYPPGFSYDGDDFLIWMSDNQKFTGPVNLPIDVYYNEVHHEGSVTVSVYHDTHSSTLTTWEKDATYHWHQCNYPYGMCDGSEVNKAEHDYSSGVCIVCGKHTHAFSSETWIQTGTHHFRPCTVSDYCPLASAGEFDDPMQDDEDFSAAYDALSTAEVDAFAYGEHQDENEPIGECDICGYAIPVHVHTPGTTYVQVGTDYHYTPCTDTTCPFHAENLTADDFTDAAVAAALNFEAHGVDYLNVCPKCFYHGQHQPHATDYVQKEGYHYKKCITPGCPYNSDNLTADDFSDADTAELFDYGVHEDGDDADKLCDKCQIDMSTHHHFFTNEWTMDGSVHYHKCIAQGCDILQYSALVLAEQSADVQTAVAYAEHTFDTNNVCTTCGYEKQNAAHVHVFGDTWYEMTVDNKQYHYKKCTADGCTINYENMSDLEKAITSYGQHQYGTSQEGAAYYTCKVCGMENATRKAIQHEHSYQWVSIATGTGATADDPEHWQECVATEGACTAAKVVPDEKKHKFDAEATDYTYYTCSICGYIDENRKAHAPHVHVFAEAWSNNETHHYHECIGTQGECTLKYDGTDNEALEKYAEHTYGASQEGAKYYTCQTCGYINTTRKNASHSHVYGGDDAWKHDNLQHWKECTAADGEQLAGPCTAPKGFLGYHEYASVDDAATTDKDERALCSVCKWYNEARKQAIDNAAAAANVQSWSWDYEIPFNFEAPVQNDRRFNAEQCYTIFLPYALELNGLKAYAIEQHNDNIVGFKEQAVTELPQLTPFVVKSETTGNPLSSAMTTVYMTLLEADKADWMTADEESALLPDRGYAKSQASIHKTGGRLYMLGTLRYLVGNEAGGRYIMQGKDKDHPNGVFKLVDGSADSGYDKVDNRACILPMRAYISTLGGDSREFLGVRLIKADGSVTTIDRLVLDPGDNTVYDLQGRRVQNPRKGNLYIIGGRKVMYK